VKGWSVVDEETPEKNKIAIEWFEAKLNQSLTELDDHFSKFRMSDALMTVYKLTWDDFCSWYLEMIKPTPLSSPLEGGPRGVIDSHTFNKTISFFETVLKVLHTFMPFITEELYHELNDREEKDCIIKAPWPTSKLFDENIVTQGNFAFQIIGEIRNTRSSKGLSPKDPLNLVVKGDDNLVQSFWPVVKFLGNLGDVSFSKESITGASSFLIKSTEFCIPLEGKIDAEKERETLQKDLEYQKGFLNSVDKKLSNEKFVNSAPPQVVEIERKKKADAEAKIRALEESLQRL
jgi:valyl-tRNA synthetase